MIVCINRSSSVWQRIQRYRHFCINILADHHNEIAERFGGVGPVDDIIAFIRADSTRAICQPKGPNGG